MHSTPKYPTKGRDPPHKGLFQGCQTFRTTLFPCYHLPDERQLPVSFHPTSEAEVQEQEGCDPPSWRGWGGGGKHSYLYHRHHPLQRGCEGLYNGVCYTQVTQTCLWWWVARVPSVPQGNSPHRYHGWGGVGGFGS